MKGKHNLATRLGGGFLAAIMLLSILPVSTIAMAVGSAPVEVKWIPNTQTKDGTRTVTLTAQLTQNGDGAPKAAMVEIPLTAAEAGALSWPESETINESDLTITAPGGGTDTDTSTPETEGSQDSDEGTTQAPDTEDSQDSDPETPQDPETDSQDPSAGQQEADGTEPSDSDDDTEETETPSATVTAAQSRTAGEQAVLIKKTNGRAVLRILLSGTTPYTQPLIFTASGSDLNVDVDEDDILVKTYAGTEGESAPTSIGAGSGVKLLTATDTTTNALDFTGTSFTVLQTVPDEVAITTSGESVSLDGEGSKDITYNITVQKLADSEGKEYTFTLTWPSELTRPSGTLEFEQDDTGGYITSDNKQLATLSTKDTGVTINGLTATDSGLSFVVKVPQATQSVDVELSEVTLTVDGSVFERSATAFSENMTLSTINSTEETISASVPVTAGDVALPGGDAGYTVVAVNRNDTLEQTVGWADGNNEAHLRPDWSLQSGKNTLTPHLYFTIDGVTWELTKENMAAVGLTKATWPTIAKTPSGFTVNGLPSQIQEVSAYDEKNPVDVTWTLEPPTVPDGYAFVEVTGENLEQYQSVSKLGWYYMLLGNFSFNLEVKMGSATLESAMEENSELIHSILQNFAFQWQYGSVTDSDSIRDMIANGYATMPKMDDNGKVTISGLWKYNLDGTPISYAVKELPDGEGEDASGDFKLDSAELSKAASLLPDQENDWFKIFCDNSGVPNHSTDTNAVYNGGKLQLILSGETTFSAEKRWLDEAPNGGLDSRPDVTFTLWRYRDGQSYSTAAPVKDGTDNVYYTLHSDNNPPTQSSEDGYSYYSISFKGTDGEEMRFPKYDSDGYAYIYGVKEEVQYSEGDNNYETLYGIVGADDKVISDSDTLPKGVSKRGNDTMLYNGGTLTNRLKDSVRVTATKQWEAAAYQAAFEDVAVELTLQSKLKGEETTWADVKDDDGTAVTHYLYNFTADRLTDSYSISMPQYNAQGLELEYRWVETAVYQNVKGTTDTAVREEIADGSATECEITEDDNGNRFFTLKQGIGATTEDVTYYSTVEKDGTIVNQVDATIDYQVIKEWANESPIDDVTINIYQVPSGSANFDLRNPYVSFQYNKDGMLEGQATGTGVDNDNDNVTVTQDQENGNAVPWHAAVNNLPRFDENGRPYEYVLLEASGFPSYETTRDNQGNYTTTVINGQGGEAIPILVRKVWLDDGDDLHREPVTFTVYNKNTNEPVQDANGTDLTVTLGDEDNPGLWHEVVKVPKSAAGMQNGVFSVGDIYVVETKVGKHDVEHYLNGTFSMEALYTNNHGIVDNEEHVFDVTTDNHRYQVTYGYKKNETPATDPGGIQGTFTVTNRRLGYIDLTVTKEWVDGEQGEVFNKINAELQEIAKDTDGTNGKHLALVFRLEFADETKTEEDKNDDGWEITYTGFDAQSDTVSVGGEEVEIYGNSEYTEQASSEQVIIGYGKESDGTNNGVITATEAHFFGLPKYDAEGKSVEYTVEELWLDVTESGSPEEVTDEEMKNDYPDLWALWQDYVTSYGTPQITGEPNHTKDTQNMTVTNTRSDTKNVTWTKVWKDDFTYNSNLRPDIFLDVYAVSHVSDGEGGVKEQITQVQKDLKWTAEGNANQWTITLSDVDQFDALGYEIMYYAVERTVVAVGDYDYQAVKYSLDTTDLGTRDHPADGAVQDGNVLDLKGKGYQYSNFKPDDLNIGQYQPGPTGTAPSYPQYGLIEGGTFTNTLADVYTIEGMKYWTSLPTGWPAANLPSVTFQVYRYTDKEGTLDRDNLDSEAPVATLTVTSDMWGQMKDGLGYRYLIQYEGTNTLSVDADGNLVCSSTEDKELPRYNDDGKLYHYLVVEEVNWDKNNKPDEGDRVFTTSYTDFTVTNEYTPTTGSTQVKKHLYLPMTTDADGNKVPEAYPAVTFQLTRQVQNDNGSYVDDTTFVAKSQVLTSTRVQTLYDEQLKGDSNGKTEGYVTDTLTFENLPIYAPNGTKYQYTVTEVKDSLQGYDTWAQKGDIASPFTDETGRDVTQIKELEPRTTTDDDYDEAQATFVNKQPDKQEAYTSFTATKIWDDNGNAYGFRPETKEFEALLTLKRSAPAQSVTGGGGAEAIKEEEVKAELTITKDTSDESKWTIEIKPANSSSGFEKYAPNGMPWEYTFSEPVQDNRLQLNATKPNDPENDAYAPTSGTGGKWPKTIQAASVSTDFGELTNTIHMEYSFIKEWQDADGETITEDYLGFDLKVSFQLQVSAGGGEWTNASEYFTDESITDNVAIKSAEGVTQGEGKNWDTATITGRVNADVWGTKDNPVGTFTKLPTVLKINDTYTLLQYRVIETSVSYGTNGRQSINNLVLDQDGTSTESNTTTGDYKNIGTGLVTGATFTRYDNDGVSASVNKLATTEVSVTKAWEDESNTYNTRPAPKAPMTWTSWFVLQRTTAQNPDENTAWDNVAVVSLHGGNGNDKGSTASPSERWEYTFAGLPTADYANGGNAYTYRIRELQPKEGGYTLNYEEDINSNIVAGGEEDPYNPDGSAYITDYAEDLEEKSWTVTNRLEVYNPQPLPEVTTIQAKKVWAVPDTDNTAKPDVTFRLQYRAEGGTWQSTQFNNAEQVANKGNNWTVTWTNLPDTIDGKTVEYQVIELSDTGWVQIDQSADPGDGSYTYTFTNTFTRDFTVEKKWNPTTATMHDVTVWLYRTTDQSKIGTTDGERVQENEMASDQNYRTATLNTTNNWKYTFTGLPKYNASGDLYYYYALELDSSGNPIAQNGKITLGNTDYEVSYTWETDNTKTTVTNTTAISLTGTKTWLDDGNKDGDRPDSLTLILERKTVSATGWTDVSKLYSPTWVKETTGDTNVWTYTYTGLPSYDASGNQYTYRVREDVNSAEGYTLENQKDTGDSGEVAADTNTNNYNFINVRTGPVNLTVIKTWVGDTEGNRPEDIDLKVECKLITEDENSWQPVSVSQTQWSKSTGSNEWTLTYSGLPQYNDEGVRYQYRITENGVPTGYEVKDSTNTDPNKQYAIQNIRKGALEIRKEVSGNRGETDREFHFTVTLTRTSMAGTQAADVDVNYTAVYTKQDGTTEQKTITFTDGKSAEFTLKHNESLVIQGLPAGLSYEVTEVERNTNGYSTTGTGWTGTIPAGGTAQAEFENYRNSSSSSNRTDVSGTKTWVDDSDAAGLRPDVLELTLYRSVDGGPEQVVNATPTWTKTGNVWTYRYANLPKYDSSGRTYTYRVVETVPEGYVSTVSGNNFTNTLTKEEEKITLTGHKSWLGDAAEDRPESITVVLYDGDGQVVRRVTVTAAENWSYVFADLPRYNAEGNEIPYYVREEGVPAGYQVSYDGLNIVNRKEDAVGALRVTKQVTGTGAEYDRAFSFTVTLEDRTINGTYGEMTFVDGVATFTLRHGQSVTAVGLPAGIPYTVTETVPEGYAASNAQQAGEIPASDLATVTVVNHRDLPEEPTNPEDPEGPENPDVPDSPDDPAGPEDPQGPEVQTGDRANLTLYGGLAALFAAGLAVTLYWGKKEDRKKDDL